MFITGQLSKSGPGPLNGNSAPHPVIVTKTPSWDSIVPTEDATLYVLHNKVPA